MLRNIARIRRFSTRPFLGAAQIFRMPAMSPTMEEGGIVAWKFKPGDEFAAGDVLLEVETDKATIDVEAQDDGVLWQVLRNDGETGIPVGKPIAYLAEPGDDLASLKTPETPKEQPEKEQPEKEQPEKEQPKKEQPEKEQPEKEQPKKEQPEKEQPEKSKKVSLNGAQADPAQKLTPAVEVLLHRHNISAEEALEKIPASGPKGRLLAGDVMAYVGDISALAVTKIADYVKSKEHLDLSNIKVVKKEPAPVRAQKPKPTNVISIEFSSDLGDDVSKEKFQFAFERALDAAKRQTYAVRFPNYARLPVSLNNYEDDIFDDLMVAPVSKERFVVSDIGYRFLGNVPASFSADAFDELLGLPVKKAPEVSGPVTAVVNFKATFDEKLTDSKAFVEYFQDALLSQIPAKQLIIHNN